MRLADSPLAANHGGKVFILVWVGFLLPAMFMDRAGTGLLYYLLFMFLLHYSFDIKDDFRIYMVHSFLQSIPLLFMLKTYLRRAPGSNRKFIAYILGLLLVLMVMAVFQGV